MLEADFWRYYKIDLNEACFDNHLTLRRFFVLQNSLPLDSAYVAWLRNDKSRDMATWDEGKIEEGINKTKGNKTKRQDRGTNRR